MVHASTYLLYNTGYEKTVIPVTQV